MIDIRFVVLPGMLLLDLAGPAEAFRLANPQRTLRGLPAAHRPVYVGPRPDAIASVGLCLNVLLPVASDVGHRQPRAAAGPAQRRRKPAARPPPRSDVTAVRVALADQALRSGKGRKQALAAAGVGGDRQWHQLRRKAAKAAPALPHVEGIDTEPGRRTRR